MSIVPSVIYQNDTVSWIGSLTSPATALVFYFSAGSETPVVVPATILDDTYTISWTCPLPPGSYRWTQKSTLNGVGRVVNTGHVKVLPDPSTAVDRRSHAEICLSAIEALIQGRLLDPTASITEMEIFEGFKAKYLAPADLLALRDRYRTELRIARTGSAVRVISIGHR